MTENFLAKQYVDHFLQREILDRLSTSDTPIRFSDLKEDGIENSLFMYHANKLIDRGLVEKQQDGFQLTTKGARWINFNDSNLLNKEVLPRPLVQCIITANGSVLIANRTGSMKEHLNEFMLPGGLHHLGKSAEESISLFFHGLFTESIETPSLISVVEAIITNDDEFVHHTISHLFVLSLPSLYLPKNNEKFEYMWMDEQIVNATNEMFSNSQIVPTIIERQHKLKEYEVFKLH